jgi:iron-siderophore transport system ATP-binding protein
VSDRPTRLAARNATYGYDGRVISDDLTIEIPDGSFTAIVGPNACGKSTLLRALSRLLTPRSGSVLLDGEDIARLPGREVARKIGLLSQTSTAPDGLTVEELVAHGRYPHQSLLRRWDAADEAAVTRAMAVTGIDDLAQRRLDELSGGQRQRAWIAMVLAQETDILLLDEPTTYLDIAHQAEVLDLCQDLNRSGHTLVAVLHDLNHACRYATHLVAMKKGQIVAAGPPEELITSDLIGEVFGLDSYILRDPHSGTPLVVPGAPRRAGLCS